MMSEITRIPSRGMSCYLIKTDNGYILIDTGTPPQRTALEKEMVSVGCVPGNLRLIILTNGGLDAAGNCAYIRDKYGTKVAVHKNDAEKLDKRIDYFPRREYIPPFGKIFKISEVLLKPLAMGMITGRELFKPDFCIDEDFDLSAYGFNARIIHVPGYTKGSIGILTPEGDFFSGNTLINTLGMYISPYVMMTYGELYASLEKIKKLDIKTVYPCMGTPFPMERFIKSQRKRR